MASFSIVLVALLLAAGASSKTGTVAPRPCFSLDARLRPWILAHTAEQQVDPAPAIPDRLLRAGGRGGPSMSPRGTSGRCGPRWSLAGWQTAASARRKERISLEICRIDADACRELHHERLGRSQSASLSVCWSLFQYQYDETCLQEMHTILATAPNRSDSDVLTAIRAVRMVRDAKAIPLLEEVSSLGRSVLKREAETACFVIRGDANGLLRLVDDPTRREDALLGLSQLKATHALSSIADRPSHPASRRARDLLDFLGLTEARKSDDRPALVRLASSRTLGTEAILELEQIGARAEARADCKR